MAFDGNGNWVSDFSAEADRDAGYKILASRFDNIFIADIATSFENCLTKDMQVKPQQNFDANSYRVINVADPVNANDAVNKETFDSEISSNTSTLLSTMYPVGSIYIGTQNTCPMESLISGSTWELVATDRALWGGDGTNANTTIAAGLPNLSSEGNTYASRTGGRVGGSQLFGVSGNYNIGHGSGGDNRGGPAFDFDASRYNPIYGNSTTVQPPAYRVNVWRRTA